MLLLLVRCVFCSTFFFHSIFPLAVHCSTLLRINRPIQAISCNLFNHVKESPIKLKLLMRFNHSIVLNVFSLLLCLFIIIFFIFLKSQREIREKKSNFHSEYIVQGKFGKSIYPPDECVAYIRHDSKKKHKNDYFN